MKAGTFIVGEDRSERLPPKHYGYWLIRWAADASESFLDGLANFEFGKNDLTEAFRTKPYYMTLQLIALDSAAYWVYATDILRVGPLTVQEMQLGVTDGIADLRTPVNSKLSLVEEKYFRASLSKYVDVLRQEIDEGTALPADVYRPGTSKVSEAFFDLSSAAYPAVLRAQRTDKLLLTHNIAESPLAVFNTLAKKIFLKFEE